MANETDTTKGKPVDLAFIERSLLATPGCSVTISCNPYGIGLVLNVVNPSRSSETTVSSLAGAIHELDAEAVRATSPRPDEKKETAAELLKKEG